MRLIHRLRALTVGAFLLVAAACGRDDGPTGTGGISVQERLALAARLSALATTLNDAGATEASLAANFAALGVIGGVELTTVSADDASVSALVGPQEAASASSYYVMGIKLTSTSVGNEPFMAIVAFRDTSRFAFGIANGSNSAVFGPASESGGGAIFETPNRTWLATSGSMSLGSATNGRACQNFPSEPGVTCSLARFGSSSLNISGSVPSPEPGNGASGSRRFSFSGTPIAGMAINVTN